jgi:PAS domain S-box-containing protein
LTGGAFVIKMCFSCDVQGESDVMVRDYSTVGSAFRNVADSAQVPAALKSGDGCFIYSNRAARDLLGYSEDEFAGLMVTQLCPADPILIMRALDRLIRERVWSTEVPMRCKDGGLVQVVCQAFAHTDADGCVLYGCVFSPVREEDHRARRSLDYELSPEETCLLRLMLEGFSDEQIASLRGADLDDVRAEVASLIAKMGSTSRTQACVHGIKAGLVL